MPAATEFEKLGAVMEEKCGQGSDGYSLAPPSSNIRNALESVREQVLNLARTHLSRFGSGSGRNRRGGELAGRERAARRTRWRPGCKREKTPSACCCRWPTFSSAPSRIPPWLTPWNRRFAGEKCRCPTLWAELVPDEAARSQLFKLVGIQPEDRAETMSCSSLSGSRNLNL